MGQNSQWLYGGRGGFKRKKYRDATEVKLHTLKSWLHLHILEVLDNALGLCCSHLLISNVRIIYKTSGNSVLLPFHPCFGL